MLSIGIEITIFSPFPHTTTSCGRGVRYKEEFKLYLKGEGKSRPAEYNQPGHIPDYVFADIAAFVNSASRLGDQ